MAEEKEKISPAKKGIAYILILRWAIALIFLLHGIEKYNSPEFGEGAYAFMASLRDDIIFAPYRDIFESFILPNANLFAFLVKYGEIGVGAAYLLGLPLRLALLVGIFLNLNYICIATEPLVIYFNLLLIVCQFVIVGISRD